MAQEIIRKAVEGERKNKQRILPKRNGKTREFLSEENRLMDKQGYK